MKEIWKDIDGYNSDYQVSNTGKVRTRKNNRWGHLDYYKLMSPSDNGLGYKFVVFHKNKKRKKTYIHRLVAYYFIENTHNKPEVNHKDGNPSNNNVNNLEWVTHKENYAHASKLGLLSCGEKRWNAKLSPKDILAIRGKYKTGNYSQSKLAKIYGVCQQTVCAVLNNGWKHI